MTDRRNRKAITVAEQVLGWGAELITDAVEHAKREIDAADGYPTKVPGASAPSASTSLNECRRCREQSIVTHKDGTTSVVNYSPGCEHCAPATATLTERAAERRYEVQAAREELRDALDAWVEQWDWITRQARQLLGQRLERIEGRRCCGSIDATCTNLAAEHRNTETGAIVDDQCSACFLAACPLCRHRPADTRRPVRLDDGRMVPGCEACRRKQLRGVAA